MFHYSCARILRCSYAIPHIMVQATDNLGECEERQDNKAPMIIMDNIVRVPLRPRITYALSRESVNRKVRHTLVCWWARGSFSCNPRRIA